MNTYHKYPELVFLVGLNKRNIPECNKLAFNIDKCELITGRRTASFPTIAKIFEMLPTNPDTVIDFLQKSKSFYFGNFRDNVLSVVGKNEKLYDYESLILSYYCWTEAKFIKCDVKAFLNLNRNGNSTAYSFDCVRYFFNSEENRTIFWDWQDYQEDFI